VSSVKEKLPELVAELTDAATMYAMVPVFHEAAQVLFAYAERVHALGAGADDSRAVITALTSMAQEADERALREASGPREGHRKAAGILHWFLDR